MLLTRHARVCASQFGMFASPRISRRTSAVASNLSLTASTVTAAARPARTR
jgi:hypothetical protein